MATYFAELDTNKKVKRVIVADQAFIDSGLVGDTANWVETFIDRDDYAGKEYTYDETKKKFIGKKPHTSWVLDVNDKWKAPKDKPVDLDMYDWDEGKLDWVKLKKL